jgi:ribosomal-protein-alanine N-acetyltransferase
MFLEYFERYPELFVVAKLGRRIAGYAITCVDGERAELASIAVDPAYRVHGVGTAMVNYTARALRRRRVRDWYLMVRIENESAIRFYKRFGFVRTRTVRDYYEDGCDAWRMRLRQSSSAD